MCLICALFSSLAFVHIVAPYSAISYACVAFSRGRVVMQSSRTFQNFPGHVTGFVQFKLAQFFVLSEGRESSLASVFLAQMTIAKSIPTWISNKSATTHQIS